jgi:hypothetical protein
MARRTKWVIILSGLLLLYTLIGFFVVPAVLKSQLEDKLPAVLHRQVSIQAIAFNPYVLSLRITGFRAIEPTGEEFASFGELFVNFQSSSLFQRSLNFSEISLTQPSLSVILEKGGKANFANILRSEQPHERPPSETTEPAPPSQPPTIRIAKLALEEGTASFEDHTRPVPYQTRIGPIQFLVTNFTTEPDASNPHAFTARMDPDTSVSWSGSFTLDPLKSSGTIVISGVHLNSFAPYYLDRFHGQIVDGLAGLSFDYHVDAGQEPLVLDVQRGAFDLKRLAVADPDSKEVRSSLPHLSVEGISANLIQRTITVNEIALADGTLFAHRDKNGILNFQKLLVRAPEEAAPSPAPSDSQPSTAAAPSPSESQPPWHIQLGRFHLDNFTLSVSDDVPATPAHLLIDQITIDVKDVAYPEDLPIRADASLRWAEKGTLAVSGTLHHSPVQAEIEATLKDFELRPLQPYLSEQTHVQVASGYVQFRGNLTYGATAPKQPLFRFVGDVALNQLAVRDERTSDMLMKWDGLRLNGLQAALSPTAIQIDQVHLKNFQGTGTVGKDGHMNLATLVRERTVDSPPPPKPKQTSTAEPLRLVVKAFVIENAGFTFADRSIQPAVSTSIQHLTGRITGFSVPDNAKTTIDLTAKADNRAPIRIRGDFKAHSKNPLLDLVVAMKGYDVPVFSAYSGKYVGYPIEKGKLSLDLKYKVADRQLSGDNVMVVDQLTLGDKTDSPDATSLPIKLALAVLTDRKGQINLDVPVSGSLDDPEFTIGRVILRALVNILEKVATSPFALLGSVVGGGDELKEIAFTAGSAMLTDEERDKLVKLAKALAERPSLHLEVSATYDQQQDRLGIARAKLRRFFKEKKLKAMGPVQAQAISIDDLVLDELEYERMVRETYEALMAATQNASPEAVLTLENLPPPPKQQSGFWDFLARLNPFGGKDKATQATKPSRNRPDVSSSADETPEPPAPSLAEMERALLEKQPVTEQDFEQLRNDRAEVVHNYLIGQGELEPERVFVTAPKTVEGEGAETAQGGKALLTLN